MVHTLLYIYVDGSSSIDDCDISLSGDSMCTISDISEGTAHTMYVHVCMMCDAYIIITANSYYVHNYSILSSIFIKSLCYG